MSWNGYPAVQHHTKTRRMNLVRLALERVFVGKHLEGIERVDRMEFDQEEVDSVLSNLNKFLYETKMAIMVVASWNLTKQASKLYEFAFGPATITEGALIIPLSSYVSHGMHRTGGISWWRQYNRKFRKGIGGASDSEISCGFANMIAVNPLSGMFSETRTGKNRSIQGTKQYADVNEQVEASLTNA